MSRNRFAITAGALTTIASVTALAVAPVVSARTARPAAAKSVAVKVASVTVGSSGKHDLLETASGRAIYLLTGDKTTHPLCESSSCIADWPLVTSTAKAPALGAGIKGKLTVWHHGKVSQLVLNGHPLYTFAGDSSAGKAGGQGLKSFGGVWEAMTASGSAFTTGSGSSNSYSSSGSSGTSTSSSSGGW